MSRRNDRSPHRRHSGGKTARSQPETVQNCTTTTTTTTITSSNQKNNIDNSKDNSRDSESSRIRRKNIYKSPEESEERRVCGFPGPDIHLAEGNKSTKGTQMTTFTEAGNATRHKAPRFAKEAHTMNHSVHGSDILTRNTIPSSPSFLEFDKQREHSIPNDTTRPESVEFGMPRNHTNHHDAFSLEAGNTATERNLSTPDGTIRPESVEIGARRKHTNQHCAKSSEPVNIANKRTHDAPYDTIRPECVELGTRKKQSSPHGAKSPKSVDNVTKRNQTTLNHTNHPESLEVGTGRRHTKQHGTKSPESVEIGVLRNHTAQHGATSPEAVEGRPQRKLTTPQDIVSPESVEVGRSAYVASGSSRSHSRPHVAESPEKTCIYQEESDIMTEAEYSATETNPSNFSHLASERAMVSLEVPEQVDDSSADKTGEQQKEAGEKHGGSNSADDDSESREFFRCQICVLDRIRRWLLIPCGHMLCFVCKQKLSICPFCRKPIEDCMQIHYSFHRTP